MSKEAPSRSQNFWRQLERGLDAFARAGTVLAGLYGIFFISRELWTFREDWTTGDVMQMSAYLFTVIGLLLSWNLRSRIQHSRFPRFRPQITATYSLLGMALIGCSVALAWMWHYGFSDLPWNALMPAVVTAGIVGERYGRLFAFGLVLHTATRRGLLNFTFLHPDGVLGLGRVAQLYAVMTAIAALPVIWAGIWWALGPTQKFQGYESWRVQLFWFWLFAVVLFYGVVMRPLYTVHRRMMTVKELTTKHFDWTTRLDEKLRKSIYSALSPEEVLFAHKQLASLRQFLKTLRTEPTWPLPAEYRRLVAINYSLPATLPVVLNLVSGDTLDPVKVILAAVEKVVGFALGGS